MWDNVPDPITGKVKKENKRKKAGPVTNPMRKAVLDRQKHKCAMCKNTMKSAHVQIDHIKEVRDGGTSEPSNLRALCANCHQEKTNEVNVKKAEKRRKQKAKESKSPPSLFGSPSKSKKSVGLFGEPGDLSDLNMFSTKGKKKKKPKSIWDM